MKAFIYVKVNCRINNNVFCGKCCYNTEMLLYREDIKRIIKLGFPKKYFVNYTEEGYAKLKNISGHCVFLEPLTGKCKIYPYRPLGCKLYPLIYDFNKNEVIVDPLCPKNYLITSQVIRKYKKYVIDLINRILRERNYPY